MEATLIAANIEKTDEQAVQSPSSDSIRELSSLELALVGGGTGTAVFL